MLCKGSVVQEIYEFIGNEATKARDVSRERAFKHIQKMMRSHLHLGHHVTEEYVEDLLHDFRRQIKHISKAHHPDIAAWNVYEVYRSTFHAFFHNPEIPKTFEGFKKTTFEYSI